MDWGKAKNVLILSFLLLNLLLGYQLWNNKWGLSDSSQDKAGLKAEVSKMMFSKGIRLESDIPTDTPKMEVTIRFDDKMMDKKRIQLKPPLESRILESSENLRGSLAAQVANIDAYEADPVVSDTTLFSMNQLHEQYPMFDVNLELFIKDGQVYAYSQSYVEEMSTPLTNKQEVLFGYIALSSLIDNYLPTGSVIKDVRLGYHGQVFNETFVLAPFWRVVLEDGKLFYVHALTGAVEQKE